MSLQWHPIPSILSPNEVNLLPVLLYKEHPPIHRHKLLLILLTVSRLLLLVLLLLLLPSFSSNMGMERRRKGKLARTGIAAACCSDGAVSSRVSIYHPDFLFHWEVMREWHIWAVFSHGSCVVFAWEAEVSSLEWEFIDMSEQEEDLIYRMYKLVGNRWALIAGRIPGRKAEEIERFWIMRHGEVFADRRRHHQKLLLWRERSPGY